MLLTTKTKRIIGVTAAVTVALFLGLLGTYLSNDCSWQAVVDLLTLPQCIIAYVIIIFATVCLLLHMALKQDNYND